MELWRQTAELFSELCSAWTLVATDEPSIRWLQTRLDHFAELARDRMEFYNITEAERLAYQQRKLEDSRIGAH